MTWPSRRPSFRVMSHGVKHAVRPRVVISACIDFEPVRYNGQVIPYDFVRALGEHADLVPVCPEVEIGLGVPRDPIRIERIDGEARLVQPSSGADLTDRMERFARDYLSSLEAVDGFILKSRSPSCGTGDVKRYPAGGVSGPTSRGPGFFGGAVLERFAGLAVEDEGRLRNFRIREHFLTRLFALARLRAACDSGSASELIRFHAEHKLLLMAYDQERLRLLGRLVAAQSENGFGATARRYREVFGEALAEMPRYTAVINVFQHALGYFKNGLRREEKRFALESLEAYRSGRIPAVGVAQLLRAWIVRFDQGYLGAQRFFAPFPPQLMSVSDSGKGGAVRPTSQFRAANS